MNLPFNGSCQCGAIQYEVSQEPIVVYACHCMECQKLSGSAFGMGMVLGSDALKVDGELSMWERKSDSGNINVSYFCKTCGNKIYNVDPNESEIVRLRAGTIDDTSTLHVELHTWTRSAQPWIKLDDEVPKFETQPDDPMEMLQAVLSYRENQSGKS